MLFPYCSEKRLFCTNANPHYESMRNWTSYFMVIVNIIWLVVYLPRKNDGVKVSWEQYIPKMETCSNCSKPPTSYISYGIISQILTRWCPPSYKWVIILLTMDISPINHSDIGLICTNKERDSELGHHPAA